MARPILNARIYSNGGRSAVTNGTQFFLFGKGAQTAYGRRFRDLCARHAIDKGGIDLLSEGEKQLIKCAAIMEVELETMQALAADGQQIDIELLGQLSDRLRRVHQTLGLEHRPRDVNMLEMVLRGDGVMPPEAQTP
jgi:hypothetical protein